MRTSAVSSDGEFKVKAITGTNTILLAMNCPEERCAGFRGFAIWRSVGRRDDNRKWLRSQKVFVGHLVRDAAVAKKYLAYWQAVAEDPALAKARRASKKVSPHPVEGVPSNSTTTVFSPRYTSAMLEWYGNRMLDAGGALMFTAACGVNQKLVGPIAEERDFLRFMLMEKRPKREEEAAFRKDRDVVISYGATLGEVAFFKNGKRQVRHI